MSFPALNNVLEKRRFEITKLLATLFVAIASLAFAIQVADVLREPDILSRPYYLLFCGLTLVTLLSFIYVRFDLIHRNVIRAYKLIVFFAILAVSLVLLTGGVQSPVPLLAEVVIIISTSIVLGIKSAAKLASFGTFTIVVISFLHLSGIIPYYSGTLELQISNVVILLAFIWLIVNTARIGYGQIEHSYQQAFDYAKELETLNHELEERVQLRTEQLRISFKQQTESMYNSAVMGRISKAMIHDITSPVTALKGLTELIEKGAVDLENPEVVDVIALSTKEISSITQNAQDLMQGKELLEDYSVYEVVENVKVVVKHLLQRNEISLNNRIDPKLELFGNTTLFERIILNLVNNAIDELAQLPKGNERKITINAKSENGKIFIDIADCGRGIPLEHIEEIFSPDFTTKKSNLGFGLAFVKSTIEDKFGGNISVKNSPKGGAIFTLEFPIMNERSHTNTK